MFTGLVREVGNVASYDGARLVVETATTAELGDSIAIDGVCLTVVAVEPGRLSFDVVPETVSRVKEFAGRVNVEPALRAGDPLGGHQVQGHVDGTGSVAAVVPEGDGVRMQIALDPELLRYCVEKGSITVDGVSLTVAALDEAGDRGGADPAHARRDDTFRARARRPRQRRGRRARQVRRAARPRVVRRGGAG